MNKQDIIKLLKDNSLDSHERETLLQLLHYMQVEGINYTSSNKRESKKRKSNSTSSNKNKRSSKDSSHARPRC